MHKGVWVCIEKAEHNYSAYAPEVPGCASAGDTVEETRANMIEALQLHFEGMLEDGDSLDGITGAFPAREAAEHRQADDLWAFIEVDVSVPQIEAGAY